MAQSVFLYGSLLAAVACLGHFASKKNEIGLLWAAVALLTFVAGVRADEVGADTRSYLGIFETISNSGLSDVAWGEIGFRVICYFLIRIWNNASFLFISFSFLTNCFFLLRFWDYREHASLAWMIALYFVSFYFMTLNIMRQMCAVAIVFYGTRYIQKQKYIRFLLFVLFGTLIHKSSLIALGFLCTELLQNGFINVHKRFITIFLSLIGICAFPLIIVTIKGYSIYFNVRSVKFGGMIMAKLLLFLVSTIGLCRSLQSRYNSELCAVQYELHLIRMSYVLGLLLTSTGYVFPIASRIGLSYYIYECVYYGIILKSSKNRKMYIAIIFLLSGYILYNEFAGGQGAVPYRFIWQKC